MGAKPGHGVGKRRRVEKRPVLSRDAPPRIAHAKFLKAGKQTKITRTVRQFANRFPGNDLRAVHALVEEIAKFPRKKFTVQELPAVYLKRTAEQIIKDKFVAVVHGENPGTYAAVAGCIDYNLVACAAFRAKGIPAKFVRAGLHSTTHFFMGNRWYEMDPTNVIARSFAKRMKRLGKIVPEGNLPELIEPLSESQLRTYSKHRGMGLAAEGFDAWAIGMRSLKDFKKFDKG